MESCEATQWAGDELDGEATNKGHEATREGRDGVVSQRRETGDYMRSNGDRYASVWRRVHHLGDARLLRRRLTESLRRGDTQRILGDGDGHRSSYWRHDYRAERDGDQTATMIGIGDKVDKARRLTESLRRLKSIGDHERYSATTYDLRRPLFGSSAT